MQTARLCCDLDLSSVPTDHSGIVEEDQKCSIYPSTTRLSTILTVVDAIYHDFELTSKLLKISASHDSLREMLSRNYAFCT